MSRMDLISSNSIIPGPKPYGHSTLPFTYGASLPYLSPRACPQLYCLLIYPSLDVQNISITQVGDHGAICTGGLEAHEDLIVQ